MGEAKKRGTREQRESEAIKRNKRELAISLDWADDNPDRMQLQAGLKPFMDRLRPGEWPQRRLKLLEVLRNRPKVDKLAEARPIRVQEDEMGWYLFLCEQAIEDPLCNEINQAQRILPFFAGLGARWEYAPRIVGIERKIDELLKEKRKEPDGLLFELLVALSYAAEGWDVAFVEEGEVMTPDIRVARDRREFFVECKRLDRRTQYSETERVNFLRLWDCAKAVLLEKGQWVWFKGTFHVDPAELPDGFLRDLWIESLPIEAGVQTLIDDGRATIQARLIDRQKVHRHMRDNRVKLYSPMLPQIIGGDWAPDDAAVTLLPMITTSHLSGCEEPLLGTFVEEVQFACGFTREFDSETSIDKKAKDFTKLLSKAVKQVPSQVPSIIHIAAETTEGVEIERRRNEKIKSEMGSFESDKPVALIRFHRLQSHQRATMLYEFDETVDDFVMTAGDLSGIPSSVIAPPDVLRRHGSHWELYP